MKSNKILTQTERKVGFSTKKNKMIAKLILWIIIIILFIMGLICILIYSLSRGYQEIVTTIIWVFIGILVVGLIITSNFNLKKIQEILKIFISIIK